MKKIHLLLMTAAILIIVACKKDDSGSWLVPKDEVLDGGPGQDGIPSLDSPLFSKTVDIDFLEDDDLIVGIEVNGEIKGYPHEILDWHEIINDQVDNKGIAITYCPLTGTGIGWDRNIRGIKTTFGVSGLLYNSNLMPYDRASGSTWSQQRLECVNGDYIGDIPVTYNLMETTWATWKDAFPDELVVNLSTGFGSSYGSYPYGDYKTNQNRLLFPVDVTDDRLAQKHRVLGIIVNDKAKAYTVQGSDDKIDVIQETFEAEALVIARSRDYNFAVAFKNLDGLTFTAVDDVPVIMEDNLGNQYDLFGKVVSGPDAGEKLEAPTAFIGYWFSWGAFYPDLALHED